MLEKIFCTIFIVILQIVEIFQDRKIRTYKNQVLIFYIYIIYDIIHLTMYERCMINIEK